MKEEHSVSLLCLVLEVSRSGYFDWLRRRSHPAPRQQENQALRQRIKRIHDRSRHTYGSPRVLMELRKEGARHGRNRIARLMKEEGLCGRQKLRWRVATTDSNHDHPIAPNRLAQVAPPVAPGQVWVGDITYIRTGQGWLFVAAIMDLYTRKIVGWSMSSRIDAALVLGAWRMALLREKPRRGLIFHSDRGVQYASSAYRDALTAAGALPSMSRRANCYDNASMESFWSTLKLEMVYRAHFATRQQARADLFDYIEAFYNRQRAHSALGYLSPVDFQTQNN
jgi:transposase InsO family protein